MTMTLATAAHRPRWGHALIVLAALGFASKGIFIKLAYALDGAIDTITVMNARMLIALPFFLVVALYTSQGQGRVRLGRDDYAQVLFLGFMGYYLSSYLDLTGLQYISAGLERLILYLYPTFVVLLSALYYRRRIHRREGGALLLSYVGIALVFMLELNLGGSQVLRGALWVLAAALSYAVFMIGSHGVIVRIGPARFTAYTMTVATTLTGLHYLWSYGARLGQHDVRLYGYASALALLGTVLPAFMLSYGVRQVGSSQAAILSSVGPVLTLLLAHWSLGEAIGPVQFAGTLLILIGIYVATRPPAQA